MVINVKNSIRRMTVLNVQTMPGDNYRPKNRIMYIIKIFSNKSNGTKKFYRQNRRHFVAQVDRKWPVEEPKLYRCRTYFCVMFCLQKGTRSSVVLCLICKTQRPTVAGAQGLTKHPFYHSEYMDLDLYYMERVCIPMLKIWNSVSTYFYFF